jgi:hypothetical protein
VDAEILHTTARDLLPHFTSEVEKVLAALEHPDSP